MAKFDLMEFLEKGIFVIGWALVALWIANNVAEIGNLCRPR